MRNGGLSAIPALIAVLIAIVVGVNLIGTTKSKIDSIVSSTTVTTIASTPATTDTYSDAVTDAVTSIANILPIIFIVMILVAAVKFIGGGGFGFGGGKEKTEKEVTVTVRTNNGKTISAVIRASESLEPYINNLDELLGIKTTVYNNVTGGLRLEPNNELLIDEMDYDWYVTAKQEGENVFKIIGLNKTDETNNVVYVLGKHDGEEPFCIKVAMEKTVNEIVTPEHMAKV